MQQFHSSTFIQNMYFLLGLFLRSMSRAVPVAAPSFSSIDLLIKLFQGCPQFWVRIILYKKSRFCFHQQMFRIPGHQTNNRHPSCNTSRNSGNRILKKQKNDSKLYEGWRLSGCFLQLKELLMNFLIHGSPCQ